MNDIDGCSKKLGCVAESHLAIIRLSRRRVMVRPRMVLQHYVRPLFCLFICWRANSGGRICTPMRLDGENRRDTWERPRFLEYGLFPATPFEKGGRPNRIRRPASKNRRALRLPYPACHRKQSGLSWRIDQASNPDFRLSSEENTDLSFFLRIVEYGISWRTNNCFTRLRVFVIFLQLKMRDAYKLFLVRLTVLALWLEKAADVPTPTKKCKYDLTRTQMQISPA